MKSFLVLSIALVGLKCAGEPLPCVFVLKRPNGNTARHCPKTDIFSIGRVFDEPEPTAQSANALRRTLDDDPRLMRDYQQKWETYLKSSHPKPTPIFDPSRTEILR